MEGEGEMHNVWPDLKAVGFGMRLMMVGLVSVLNSSACQEFIFMSGLGQ